MNLDNWILSDDGPALLMLNDSADPADRLPADVVAAIIHYRHDDYDGGGQALILFSNGMFDLVGLGHCSCYGPWEDGYDCNPKEVYGTYTRDEVLDLLTLDYSWDEDKPRLNILEAFKKSPFFDITKETMALFLGTKNKRLKQYAIDRVSAF